ncbi:hypothetical protein MMC07_005149 [Pseudocyphellaria aurata]|nr:hypothetical protein [Pseudocyphellaria aurata]
MPNQSRKRVNFLTLPLLTSESSPEPGTAFGVRPRTPYPMSFFTTTCSPLDKAKTKFDAGDKATSEPAETENETELKFVVRLGSVLESAAGSDARNESDESESEAEIDLESKTKQEIDSSYTQSYGHQSQLGYQFPFLVANSFMKASNPAHQISTYPFTSPGAAIKEIFSTAESAALEYYAKNSDRFTNPDGSHCPLVYPWMNQLIVDKIKAARLRALKWIEPVDNDDSDDTDDKFQTSPAQPWLCDRMRREAIRAAEEAFKEIDKREGLFSAKGLIVINSAVYGKASSSRSSFSFNYPGTHMAHSSSITIPCLCKEGLANRVGFRVLAIIRTAFVDSIARPKNDVSLSSSSSSQDRKMVRKEDISAMLNRKTYLATLPTLVADAMSTALEIIARTQDQNCRSATCGWFDMVHVRHWMVKTLWQHARQVVENAEKVLRSDSSPVEEASAEVEEFST